MSNLENGQFPSRSIKLVDNSIVSDAILIAAGPLVSLQRLMTNVLGVLADPFELIEDTNLNRYIEVLDI